MSVLTIDDLILRDVVPYPGPTTQGWVHRGLGALVDLSAARAFVAHRVMTTPAAFSIRVAVRRAPSMFVVEGIETDLPPTIACFVIRVDESENFVGAGVTASAVSLADGRLVAVWDAPPSWAYPAEHIRVVLTLMDVGRVVASEVAAWSIIESALRPSASDDPEPPERVSYTITGVPYRYPVSERTRRVSVRTVPEHGDAADLRRKWLAQHLAGLMLGDLPDSSAAARADKLRQHLIVGLPTAGACDYEGVGAGAILSSVSLGLVELGSSSLTVLEEAIMSYAACSLSPIALRPLAGEWLAGFTGSTLGTQASAAGRIDLTPIVMPVDISIDQVAIDVTTPATGDARVVIYLSDDLGRPSGVYAQSADMSTGTAGLRTAALATTLRAGAQYWIGIWTQAAPVLRVVTDAVPISWSNASPPAPRRVLRKSVAWTGSASTWTYTASDPVAASAPAVILRVA